ncbi:MAG: Cysteine desulfurase [Candidatus Magasanikbacteria bacterium GW2011_GWC2_45_8]|uniref:Cysteine desulfurase n=1 Tax=Candidatus Magasanikbacteria bacterium GW2011_GWC2_45_8 TaxID=1619050 RepID=A0A0G1MZI6_9BACT|nr:MAG: Cysteine desulfurase [Candidatus Magasanikbacteria bacterium GW2011_GWC2_45_8]
MQRIYLDHAAATPVDKEVVELVARVSTSAWANPSSIHAQGLRAAKYIKDARERVAQFLSCQSEEVIFTASGTEANNLALFGLTRAHKKEGKRILISALEHESVRACAGRLAKEGFIVETVPVNKSGELSVSEVEKRLTKSTIMVSLMAVNNEIGTVLPIAEIGKMLLKNNKERHTHGLPRILFHTDTCQAAALFPLNVNTLHVDALTLNGSKIYGPKGVGALYLRRGTKIEPLVYGGGQEQGMQSGTENTPGIAGFGLAIECAEKICEKEFDRLNHLRAVCIKRLSVAFPKIQINGSATSYAPHILNITLNGLDAEAAVVYLSGKGIDVASGSACVQKSAKQSPTLKAIGLSAGEMKSTLRVSFGRTTTTDNITKFVTTLKSISSFIRL